MTINIIKPSAAMIDGPGWGEGALALEIAAKTCTGGYKGNECKDNEHRDKFLKSLWERGHHSVFEHLTYSFDLVCDRGVSHELVRHRMASYCQQSTRYCRIKESMDIVIPSGMSIGCVNRIKSHATMCFDTYLYLIETGSKPEIARAVLPNCLATEIYMTANLREWAHIIKLRTDKAAHPQMRELIGMVRREFINEAQMPEWVFQ